VDKLAAEHAERGRTPVVVIDEAHLLDNAQMEAIRMLTNHDMDSGLPFAAPLVGQPTLRHRLRLGVLAALDQRIAVRYSLAGMTPADTADYIAHHAKIAGRTDPLFSDDAITLIHNAARGYPRAVNNLAVHARPRRPVRPRGRRLPPADRFAAVPGLQPRRRHQPPSQRGAATPGRYTT
jgi:type II secretory pathway predicted ATPase ExeA